MQNRLVTPKQVAQAIGVSESSLKRWCDKGLLTTVRTIGGHRRLPLEGVIAFLRQSGQQLIQPELLGLPSSTGHSERAFERAQDLLFLAIVHGDEPQSRRIVFDLFLSGRTACDICDQVIAPVFHQIGELWARGTVSVYRERLACEIAHRILADLRQAIAAPGAEALLAIGGALEHDPYTLPTAMVEVVLREAGWRATSLGSLLPAATLREAIVDQKPRLLWISVSSFATEATFLQEYQELFEFAVAQGTAVAVGGRGLTGAVRKSMNYSAYCDTLRHLTTFAATMPKETEPKDADNVAANEAGLPASDPTGTAS